MKAKSIARRLSLTEMALQGLSQRDMAKACGLTHGRISQILSSDAELRAQISDGQKAQVVLLRIALKRHSELLESEDEKIALAAVKLTYDTTSIAPSHAQSILIQNLFINQESALQDAAFRSLAMRFIGLDPGQPDATLLDVTPISNTIQSNQDKAD